MATSHAAGLFAVCLGLGLASAARPASAYSTGVVVPGCGCHNGGSVPEVKLLTPNNLPTPGETITLSVVIQAVNGNAGGFFLQQLDGGGSLMPGAATRQPMPNQIVHSMPARATGNEVRFDMQWTAPSTPGGAYFQVYAVSANGSGAPTGDNFGSGALGVAVGCSMPVETYYADSDKDGVGSATNGVRPGCAAILPLLGWATADGDCDENRAEVNPRMPEVCNMRDDDCDGKVDEGVESALVYPDMDEDGYGDRNGTAGANCGKRGFAPNRGDCDDRDKTKNPGVPEICNAYDDNCDGDVDEQVRPACGIGVCATRSVTCEAANCEPGLPEPEVCDLLDNDCDASVDEGLSCRGSGGAAGSIGGPAAPPPPMPVATAAPVTASASAPLPATAPGASTSGCSVGAPLATGSSAWLSLAPLAFALTRRRVRSARHQLARPSRAARRAPLVRA